MQGYRYKVTMIAFYGAAPLTYIEYTLAKDVETARAIIRERYRHAYEITIEPAKG